MRWWRAAVGLGLAAIACGETLAPTKDPGDGVADGGADSAREEPREPHLDTVPCGDASCAAAKQACCLGPNGASCSVIGGSCPIEPDASVDGGDSDGGTSPGLLCTTYNNCTGKEVCCYSAQTGSTCTLDCPPSSSKLCRLGQDNCGFADLDCKSFAGSPDGKSIGRCEYVGYSGSSSGGWNGSGGFP